MINYSNLFDLVIAWFVRILAQNDTTLVLFDNNPNLKMILKKILKELKGKKQQIVISEKLES